MFSIYMRPWFDHYTSRHCIAFACLPRITIEISKTEVQTHSTNLLQEVSALPGRNAVPMCSRMTFFGERTLDAEQAKVLMRKGRTLLPLPPTISRKLTWCHIHTEIYKIGLMGTSAYISWALALSEPQSLYAQLQWNIIYKSQSL